MNREHKTQNREFNIKAMKKANLNAWSEFNDTFHAFLNLDAEHTCYNVCKLFTKSQCECILLCAFCAIQRTGKKQQMPLLMDTISNRDNSLWNPNSFFCRRMFYWMSANVEECQFRIHEGSTWCRLMPRCFYNKTSVDDEFLQLLV